MGFEGLRKKGIRLSIDAEEFISKKGISEEEIISLDKHFVNLEDVQRIISEREDEKNTRNRSNCALFSPPPCKRI